MECLQEPQERVVTERNRVSKFRTVPLRIINGNAIQQRSDELSLAALVVSIEADGYYHSDLLLWYERHGIQLADVKRVVLCGHRITSLWRGSPIPAPEKQQLARNRTN